MPHKSQKFGLLAQKVARVLNRGRTTAPHSRGRKFTSRASHVGAPFNAFFHSDPFPARKHVKLQYAEILSLSTSNSTNVCGVTYFFGLNALWDVYLAAGGHQPYGFDQLVSSTGPYSRYKVNGCHIELEFYDPSADTGLNLCAAIHDPTDYAVGSTIAGLTLDKIAEKQNTWTRFLSTTGSQTIKLTKYFSMAKLFEWRKTQYAADTTNTTGNYAGNPASIAALEIGILDTRAAASSTVQVKIKLTFTTELYQRLQLGQS